MDWAKSSGQHIGMLLINYAKEYDRVEWEFILMMLDTLSFPYLTFYMVSILMKDATIVVEVNGVRL